MATIEPQMAVDARIQQLTADKSFGGVTEGFATYIVVSADGAFGECNRGLLEFSDFLKRPVDSFKYL